MAAARARDYYDQLAKERLRLGQDRGRAAQNPYKEKVPETKAISIQSRDQVGKVFGVNGKYVDYATKVLREAEPGDAGKKFGDFGQKRVLYVRSTFRADIDDVHPLRRQASPDLDQVNLRLLIDDRIPTPLINDDLAWGRSEVDLLHHDLAITYQSCSHEQVDAKQGGKVFKASWGKSESYLVQCGAHDFQDSVF